MRSHETLQFSDYKKRKFWCKISKKGVSYKYNEFPNFFSQSVSLTQYVVLCVRLFQLASGEVSLTILSSNIV